jgi:purine nucleosidase
MAYALQPDGALEVVERPVAVELAGIHARGATVVDWQRQVGRADNASILMRYDQGRFEGMIRAALAAG